MTQALSAAVVSEAQAGRLFGRLADKKLLLDVPGAGTPEMRQCCHGGCDNCDYSRVFDEMNAAKPKWVACYAHRRLIDGREHEPPWVALFADGALTARAFADRVNDVDYRPSMGPAAVKDGDDSVDEAAAVAFFEDLLQRAGVAPTTDELTADQFAQGLAALSGERHGAVWRRFLAGLR